VFILLLYLLHFKNCPLQSTVPSTGDTPFPTFLPLLEYFPERTFCDGAQFSYRLFLNLILASLLAEMFCCVDAFIGFVKRLFLLKCLHSVNSVL
jgi:hypothetical protein